MRAGRFWMRLGRFFMMAASWLGELQKPRLPRLFFMFAQAPYRIQLGAYAGRRAPVIRAASSNQPDYLMSRGVAASEADGCLPAPRKLARAGTEAHGGVGIFRQGGCILSRPRVCWATDIARSL